MLRSVIVTASLTGLGLVFASASVVIVRGGANTVDFGQFKYRDRNRAAA